MVGALKRFRLPDTVAQTVKCGEKWFNIKRFDIVRIPCILLFIEGVRTKQMPTRYEGTASEQLALNTFIKLQRAATTFQSALTRKETIGPLTLSQFAVLEALFYAGPMCVGEIGSKVLKSDGNMTLVVDNLEKQGYVQRRRDPGDRRLVRVHITEAGTQLIQEIMPNHVATIREMMSVLTVDEQIQLSDLCRKLGIAILEESEAR